MSSEPALRVDILLALAAVYTIWSSTYYAIRILVEDAPPLLTSGVRFVLAGSVLACIARARGASFPTFAQWKAAAPVGLLFFVVGNGFVALAERNVGSGVAAVVCGTMPLWAGLFAPVFGERASGREWAGMLVGFMGVTALVFDGELQSEPVSAILLGLSPIGWAFGSLWSRRLPLAKGAMGAATQMVWGGTGLLVIGSLMGEHVPSTLAPESIIAFFYLVVFGSIVAFTAYSHLLANARPALAMSCSYVNPVLAVVLGAALGGEVLGQSVLLATVLVASAVFLLVRVRTPATKTS